MNRTKHKGPTVVTHEVGDKPGISCRNAMNRKYMLATLVNCWNRLTGRKLSTVYFAVLMLLPGSPRGSNRPKLVQNSRKDPPGYCAIIRALSLVLTVFPGVLCHSTCCASTRSVVY